MYDLILNFAVFDHTNRLQSGNVVFLGQNEPFIGGAINIDSQYIESGSVSVLKLSMPMDAQPDTVPLRFHDFIRYDVKNGVPLFLSGERIKLNTNEIQSIYKKALSVLSRR
jgi:hypothetical protein